MAEAAAAQPPKPVVPFLKFASNGKPFLEGQKCGKCGAVYEGERQACAKCFARGSFSAIKLADSGKLHTYTIVYRSFPGVQVPFVSAVVDLDGGGTIKGNLIDIKPDPKSIEMGMPVEVIFDDAGRTDKEGNRYVSYFFKPKAKAK
jgi:uncharacterized OB-fold protein